MEDLVNAVIKSYGLVGLIIIVPMVAVVWLWRDNVRLNDKMREMQNEHSKLVDQLGQRVAAAQEKRVDDSHGITTKLVEMIAEHTAAAEKTNLALDRIGDMVSMLNAQQTSSRRGTGS